MRASARARQFFGEARRGQVNSRHYSARQNANLSLSTRVYTSARTVLVFRLVTLMTVFVCIFNSYGMRSRRVNTIFVTSRVRCWSRRVQGRVVLSQSRRCYSAWVVSFGPRGANKWFYECGITSLLSSRGSLLESWRVKQPLYVRPRPSDLTLGRPDQVCMLNVHTYSRIVFPKKTASCSESAVRCWIPCLLVRV